ncbi:arginyl-tRNA synthetase [Owenweeksia hongkongensis DSM 17368]|uniref:Arginine--tRNA ligase n=1 Tax=Owenweeksia hongkongensis (strain DSM 17368 / CIP 108786 / JCM 12287 / NRRL B-23963 / UST20020801) TaxID=926562 RepID=G8R1I3_OWEHD|nr:arginine--tRNA ligase [Owenweeksia hongkongensis]AEV31722.1 arginyl-tRNA synthetase [Owenweeksia hongkongensis DSM 17368]
MIELKEKIEAGAVKALKELYALDVEAVDLQQTRKDFEGDLTIVVFPYLRASKKGPEQTANDLGEFLVGSIDEVSAFNVVKGFLNLVISDAVWASQLAEIGNIPNYGIQPEGDETILVEYSSPNTNKPLHLGHVRNNLLGYSVAELLKAAGKKVKKVQIINDRGIHICKSMLAWEKFGNGETPESTGMKGDKLVGKYYVEFDKAYKKEIEELISQGKEEKEAKDQAPIILEARQMLKKWEDGDAEVVALWEKMNGWVYDGFEKTYKTMGVDFDKYYYESNTYLLGKKVVEEGLAKGVFEKDRDGSVWIDLTAEGLDRKILLRSDGTSVYMTQDIGTAIQRAEDFDLDGMIYTVGNEQDYHFKVLFIIMEKLGYDWAKNLYHLSYGMVDLPSGKMKSREGTVVDADDLMQEMEDTAKAISEELGKTEGMAEEDKQSLYQMVGMGALKYFMLKVDPKKRMMFNPEESVDFQGNTGPFIQYTHARIKSLLRRGKTEGIWPAEGTPSYTELQPSERELVKLLAQFPEIITTAADEHSPAVVANYVYEVVKAYNALYQQLPIMTDDNKEAIVFRLNLSSSTAEVVKTGMRILGIDVPERM